MPYFGEPVGRVKIQITSKHSQRYYTTKRLIRDLSSNTPNWYVRASEFRGLPGMRDRSMRSGTELAREIKLISRWQETCLTGPLEYKYRVIFVLVLSVIYTLRRFILYVFVCISVAFLP